MTKIIEILYADSGNGHTSIAKAVAAAIQDTGTDCRVRLVNGIDISPRLFKGFTKSFLFVFHHVYWLYRLIYAFTDNYISTRIMEFLLGVFFGREIQKYIESTEVDLFISCHLLFNLAMPRFAEGRVKYASIINDPFSPHADNFSERMNLCIVASEEAGQIAIKQHISQDKICLIGHPIQPEFMVNSSEKNKITKKLRFDHELPSILIAGGGEGWGKIASVVDAINDINPRVQMVVICGHNRKLYDRLINKKFKVPSRILAFISPKEMSSLMQTAYLIVTKAGPNTIFESFQAGLPIILFDAVRGQEVGNVDYVCKHAAGFFCASPRQTAQTVELLLKDTNLYQTMSANSRSLATPTAAFNMAKACCSLMDNQTP